jgi:ribonuclease HI
MLVEIFFDGAYFNKKGASAIAVFLSGKYSKEYSRIEQISGEGVTNNVTEWEGLIMAIKAAIFIQEKFNTARFVIKGDSQLVVNQANGRYGVNKPHLAKLKQRFDVLQKQLNNCNISWIPSELNTFADVLSTRGLRGDISVDEPSDKALESSRRSHLKPGSRNNVKKQEGVVKNKAKHIPLFPTKKMWFTEMKIGRIKGYFVSEIQAGKDSVQGTIII